MPGRNAASDRQKLEAEQRRAEILALRIGGASMGEIARVLNLSKSTVSGHINKALAEAAKLNTESADRLRALQTQRLDTLLKGIWTKATNGTDPKLTREARYIIMAQAKLLGLEAPIKIAHTDPTGNEERSPADWIMPMPPELDAQTWATQTQAMLRERQAKAENAVAGLLDNVAKAREDVR